MTSRIKIRTYQDGLIRKGLEDVACGKIVSSPEVVTRLKNWGGLASHIPHSGRAARDSSAKTHF
jgi:predicted transcriptional regulator